MRWLCTPLPTCCVAAYVSRLIQFYCSAEIDGWQVSIVTKIAMIKKMKRHILLPTIGSAGDVHPVLAIALALQDRGERVTVITNGHFQQLVEGHGLDFIPLGSAELYEQVTANPDLWHPTKSFQVVAEFAIDGFIQPLYDIIAGYDPYNTLVASSGLLLGARMAYEKLGTPWITVHLQPSLLRSAYDPPVLGGIKLPGWMPPPLVKAYFRFLDVAVIDRTVAPYVNPRRTAIRLPPQKGFMSNSVHAPLQSIGLFPGWFAPPQPDWPPQFTLTGFVRYDRGEGGALSAELTTFLAAGEPPLVFTPGSSMQHGSAFFEAAIGATQRLGRRAVLVTQYPEQLPPDLPQDMLAVRYVPFSQLLPHAAALIYHGGIGTLAQAVAAGIPHLVMPLGHDQPDNAHRLERLGIGASLPPQKFKVDLIAGKLAHLLDSADVRERCRALAQQVDFDANLQATCDAIVATADRVVGNRTD